MRPAAGARARDRIDEIATHGLDVVTFLREATDVLRPVVPHFFHPCWFTYDPASLLITSHFQEGVDALSPWCIEAELGNSDVFTMVDVANSPSGWNTLHHATDGDPARSQRWRSLLEDGADQEFVTGLRTRDGEVWGAVGLYREPGQPLFDDDEIAFMRSIAPALAVGVRRGLLVGEAQDPDTPDAPGLVVLAHDWSIESATPGVERWLTQMPDGDWDRGLLPSALLSVAGSVLRGPRHADAGPGAVISRVLLRSGTWVVLHGASLATDGSRRAAVIVEPANPARIASLLMSVYGLTEREQDVTRSVLRGDSTHDIAASLAISPHTVQEHLKKIFDKTAVRSRRDLLGKVFFSHYEPRVRDNEARMSREQAMRGGPIPPKVGSV